MNRTQEFGYSIIHYLPSPELGELGSKLMLALVVFPTGNHGTGKLYVRKSRLENLAEFGGQADVSFVSEILYGIGTRVSTCADPETAFAKVAALLTFTESGLAPSPVRKARGDSIEDALVHAGFDPQEFDLVFPEIPISSTIH